jgi:magnesium transporter
LNADGRHVTRERDPGVAYVVGLRSNLIVPEEIDKVDADALPPDAIWIDLPLPPGEDKAVEKLVGIEIPTREDMQEIEISSRLYIENNARYMTATLMCATDPAIRAPRRSPSS